MAVVHREGGNDPLQVNGWRDVLKVYFLERMYDDGRGGTHRDQFWHLLLVGPRYYRAFVGVNWGHVVSQEDVEVVLREMYEDGWVRVIEYDSSCGGHQSENIFERALRFALTDAGYQKVPEHIFP